MNQLRLFEEKIPESILGNFTLKSYYCPHCNSQFGFNSDFHFGCTNRNCAGGQPTFHDPIGQSWYVEKWWNEEVLEESLNV